MVRVAWMKNCGGGGGGGEAPGRRGERGRDGRGARRRRSWMDGAREGERESRKQVCFGSFSGAVGVESRPWPREKKENENINAKEKKARKRMNISRCGMYVFGEQVGLDLTFPLSRGRQSGKGK